MWCSHMLFKDTFIFLLNIIAPADAMIKHSLTIKSDTFSSQFQDLKESVSTLLTGWNNSK